MWGCSSNYPVIRNYADAEHIYNNTKPLRNSQAFRPLDARSARAKSQIVKRGEDYVIQLYRTDIVTYRVDGSVVLCCGGYSTVTTHAAIGTMSPYPCWSSKGQTAIRCASGDFIVPRAGLVIRADGTPVDPPAAVLRKIRVKRAEAKLARTYFKQVPKLIEAYSAAFAGGSAPWRPVPVSLLHLGDALSGEDASTISLSFLDRRYDYEQQQNVYVADSSCAIKTFWKRIYDVLAIYETYEVPQPYGTVA